MGQWLGAFLAGFLAITSLSALETPPQALEIGTLDRELADVGCMFVPRQAKWSSDPIFIVTVLGDKANWIKLGGRQIRLAKTDGKAQKMESFAGDGVQVVAKYGPFKYAGDDGEVMYKRAVLEITYGGQTKIILAKGYCGYLEKEE
jgi:hypothetical protein